MILIIVAIEFCTGFLRNGVMSWYPKFAKAVGHAATTSSSTNWGMLLCVVGIIGGMFAGVISDRVFQSRRGPVASVLYGGHRRWARCGDALPPRQPWVGWVLVFMALNYVGVHGMLSGTASADFGGKKNAGVAVGHHRRLRLPRHRPAVARGRHAAPRTERPRRSPANWVTWPRR